MIVPPSASASRTTYRSRRIRTSPICRSSNRFTLCPRSVAAVVEVDLIADRHLLVDPRVGMIPRPLRAGRDRRTARGRASTIRRRGSTPASCSRCRTRPADRADRPLSGRLEDLHHADQQRPADEETVHRVKLRLLVLDLRIRHEHAPRRRPIRAGRRSRSASSPAARRSTRGRVTCVDAIAM